MLNEIKPITADELAKSTKSKVEIALDELVKQATEEKDKRIEELEKENKKLKAQIEKMKCCANCACLCECGIKGFDKCKNYNKWELREIKEND